MRVIAIFEEDQVGNYGEREGGWFVVLESSIITIMFGCLSNGVID